MSGIQREIESMRSNLKTTLAALEKESETAVAIFQPVLDIEIDGVSKITNWLSGSATAMTVHLTTSRKGGIGDYFRALKKLGFTVKIRPEDNILGDYSLDHENGTHRLYIQFSGKKCEKVQVGEITIPTFETQCSWED